MTPATQARLLSWLIPLGVMALVFGFGMAVGWW
jgi:hypothetical protein